MKKIKCIFLTIILLISLSGCGKSIVGKWGYSLYGVSILEIEFKSDGTMTLSSYGIGVSGTYKIDNDKLTIELLGSSSEECTYTIEDSTLKLTYGGIFYTLTKQ